MEVIRFKLVALITIIVLIKNMFLTPILKTQKGEYIINIPNFSMISSSPQNISNMMPAYM